MTQSSTETSFTSVSQNCFVINNLLEIEENQCLSTSALTAKRDEHAPIKFTELLLLNRF